MFSCKDFEVVKLTQGEIITEVEEKQMTKKLSRTQVINLLSKHQTKQFKDSTVTYQI